MWFREIWVEEMPNRWYVLPSLVCCAAFMMFEMVGTELSKVEYSKSLTYE